MEVVKKEATGATAAKNIQLEKRIEEVSIKYIDLLEKSITNEEVVNTDLLHTLNDCIRVLHHIKKMNC